MNKEKITHKQARIDVTILNRANPRLRLVNIHEERLNVYISQQEAQEETINKLDNYIKGLRKRENDNLLVYYNTKQRLSKKTQLLELYRQKIEIMEVLNSLHSDDVLNFEDFTEKNCIIDEKIKELEK